MFAPLMFAGFHNYSPLLTKVGLLNSAELNPWIDFNCVQMKYSLIGFD